MEGNKFDELEYILFGLSQKERVKFINLLRNEVIKAFKRNVSDFDMMLYMLQFPDNTRSIALRVKEPFLT